MQFTDKNEFPMYVCLHTLSQIETLNDPAHIKKTSK